MADNEKRLADALGNVQDIIAEALESIKKPLLADAQVGDIVKRRDGRYGQVTDCKNQLVTYLLSPESYTVRVSKFGMYSQFNEESNADIISCEPLAEVGSAEWAWQMMLLGRDNYLDEVKDAYISSLESDKERLTKAVEKAVAIIYEDICRCPLLESDKCMFPPDGCDHMDEESAKGCWKLYLMGDE